MAACRPRSTEWPNNSTTWAAAKADQKQPYRRRASQRIAVRVCGPTLISSALNPAGPRRRQKSHPIAHAPQSHRQPVRWGRPPGWCAARTSHLVGAVGVVISGDFLLRLGRPLRPAGADGGDAQDALLGDGVALAILVVDRPGCARARCEAGPELVGQYQDDLAAALLRAASKHIAWRPRPARAHWRRPTERTRSVRGRSRSGGEPGRRSGAAERGMSDRRPR